eukprot:482000-Rhodomonas_salina.1
MHSRCLSFTESHCARVTVGSERGGGVRGGEEQAELCGGVWRGVLRAGLRRSERGGARRGRRRRSRPLSSLPTLAP